MESMRFSKWLPILLLIPVVVRGQMDDTQQVDALFRPLIKPDQPGAAVLVVKDGQKLVDKGYGLANLKTQAPITPTTVFELASCSKQFTAMAIMMLEEAGELSYDDKLTDFFPEFPAWANKVTVKHLLHHTAGLPDYFDAYEKTDQEGVPRSELMLQLIAKKRKPLFAAGEQYDYSNSGYMVLAQIVEKVSGETFPDFIRTHIFEPLGMNKSLVFSELKPRIVNRAHCYEKSDGSFKDTSEDDLSCIYGDGSVRSTLEDLYLWDQALYSEELVTAETLEQAFTSGTTNDGEETGYGFGWDVGQQRGEKTVSHTGLWLDFNTMILRIPEQQLTVIVLSNREDFDSEGIAKKVANLYLPAKRKAKD